MKAGVAVLLDGLGRKIVAIKAFASRPRTTNPVDLVAHAISSGGVGPRLLITDHGSQVGDAFKARIEDFGIKPDTPIPFEQNGEIEPVI